MGQKQPLQEVMLGKLDIYMQKSEIRTLPNATLGFPGGSLSKESACNAGDLSPIPGLGRSPGEGHGNPLQYSCLENPMDIETWKTMVHMVAKSQTRLKRLNTNTHIYKHVK